GAALRGTETGGAVVGVVVVLGAVVDALAEVVVPEAVFFPPPPDRTAAKTAISAITTAATPPTRKNRCLRLRCTCDRRSSSMRCLLACWRARLSDGTAAQRSRNGRVPGSTPLVGPARLGRQGLLDPLVKYRRV
ncbi:MAG TPA: hypothetical protein VEJ84_18795, partial [Acidimicrobiales bacterium]|nr:hypothetical protein [Acidimicrobiales bacterium]